MSDMFGDNRGGDSTPPSPFHGHNSVVVADGPGQANASLDFIGGAAPAGGMYRIKKRSGQVIGPFDHHTVIKMFEEGQLTGSEEGSSDGASWKPLAQIPVFAPVIQKAMAAALAGLDGLDLPAPAGMDLPAPSGMDLPAPAGGIGLPQPAGVGLPTPANPYANLPQPQAGLPVPQAQLGQSVPQAQGYQQGYQQQGYQQQGFQQQAPGRAPAKSGKGKKIALIAAGVVVLLIVGAGVAAQFLTEHGWFGHKLIMAMVSGEAGGPNPGDPIAPIKLPDIKVPPEELLKRDNYLAYRQGAKMQGQRVEKGKAITPIPPAAREAAAEQARFLAYLLVVEELDQFKKPLADAVVLATAGSPGRLIGEAAAAYAGGRIDEGLKKVAPFVGEKSPLKGAALAEMQLWLGLGHRLKGDEKKAAESFDLALQADGHHLAAMYQQASLLFGAGEVDDALYLAEKIISLDDEHPRATLMKARVLTLRPKQREEGVKILTALAEQKAGGVASATQRADANMGLADLALGEQRWADALRFMKVAVGIVPNNRGLRLRVGEMALKMRDFVVAEDNYHKVLDASPNDANATIGLARARIGAGKKLEAYTLISKAAKRAPDDAELAYWQGVTAWSYSKQKEALSSYENARKLDPTFAPPVAALVIDLVEKGKLKKASKLVAESNAKIDKKQAHHLEVAKARLALGKRALVDAERALEKALKQNMWSSEARVLLAGIMVDDKRVKKAREVVDTAMSLDPKNPRVMAANGMVLAFEGDKGWEDPFVQAVDFDANDYRLYLMAARAAMKQDNYARGKYFIDLAEPIQPKNPEVMRIKGMVLRAQDPKIAEQVLRSAMEISPEDPQLPYELGITYQNMGRNLEAKDRFKEAIALDPGYVDAMFAMGVSLDDLGQRNRARATFKDVVKLDPTRADAHIQIAQILAGLGDPRGAIRAFDRAAKAEPKSAEPYCAKGTLLVQQLGTEKKYLRQGVQALEACVRKAPKHTLGLRVLADAYADLGKKANAIKLYRRHLGSNPDASDAASTCDRLALLGDPC
jgi:tetratricopeptide (TPR) repeat protein